MALAGGIAIGWHQDSPVVWPMLLASLLLTALAVAARVLNRRTAMMTLLAAAFASLGVAWVSLHQHLVGEDDLAAMVAEEPQLVSVQGEALGPPVPRQSAAGSMARFDYRKPALYFPMRVDALIGVDGAEAVSGHVLVKVEEAVEPFRAGDRVQATGFLIRPSPPRNPGEFNYRQYARSLGQAGLLTVSSRDLLNVSPPQRYSTMSTIRHWRDQMRHRASAWLLADLPTLSLRQRDSLLANIMLGERDAQIDGVYQSFQRVGLAHILAISGFHLSVLAAFVLFLARWFSGFHRWHGILVIGVVLLYMMLIELHMPVLRSGVMTIAACMGLSLGRRLRVSNLVALSAILLLLWRPDQLFNAGFQLTYGVVFALIHLGPPLRRRWFGDPDPAPASTAQMLSQWLRTTVVVSVVAWVVATPIAMCHFGMISPLGAPLSIIAVPLSAFLLAVGFLKMILSAILPGPAAVTAMIVGIPLSISSDALMGIVLLADGWSWSIVQVPQPSVVWTLAALVWACWWAAVPRRGKAKVAAFTALIIWFVAPSAIAAATAPALRIDMLSVGDGSCYALRSGDSTIVFDAGSSSDLNVGRRTVIPAFRKLGIRSINAIAISHANLDHYSAVLELVEQFKVPRVLLTPHLATEGASDADTPIAYLLERLNEQGIELIEVAAGETRRFGQAEWTWLNPPRDAQFERVNDSSMVIRIECSGRHVLLCGDIMQETMEKLMECPDDAATIGADVIELPHHGSHHKAAEHFVDAVNPSIVLQSTGRQRWKRDKWVDAIDGRQRLVTARDGACWVEIDDGGQMRTGKFIAR